jgi:acyl dehydratase
VFERLMMPMAKDPELDLDFLRLVHGEHAMRFLAPMVAGTTLELEGELLSADQKPTGLVVRFALRGRVAGVPALEGETSYFIRSATPPERGADKPAREPAAPPPAPDLVLPQRVAADQATRYADASGDRNPIHLDDDVARRAGLPGVILHGLCTMAFAARDLVATLGGGDPRSLAEIAVRFARPVLPGQALELRVWSDGPSITFQTVDDAGRPVLTGGRARISRHGSSR